MAEKTSHLYVHPVGLALALTGSIIYALCAFFVVILPTQTLKFFNYWFHGIDLAPIYRQPQITVGSFLFGLVSVIVFTYITGAIFAWAYNKCFEHCRRMGWI